MFAQHADPVGLRHVIGLARPRGNVTGVSMVLTDRAKNELEILAETRRGAQRVGLLEFDHPDASARVGRASRG